MMAPNRAVYGPVGISPWGAFDTRHDLADVQVIVFGLESERLPGALVAGSL
jgi:hypothetical protein